MTRPCLDSCGRMAVRSTKGGSRCLICERARNRVRERRRAEYTTPEYKAARTAMWGAPCWRCGKRADTADHVKPVREGGTWRDGLRPACRACNSDWQTAGDDGDNAA